MVESAEEMLEPTHLTELYEISDEPQRREFLDDLFAFMQGRGTPITRLPVMAKTVLDLYELYNLVVARGGLVAVINKKLWQEIIKGLRLPSSITSAAFTLRTQYMRFLYDYECHKKNFSTRSELDAAIEGNKREGRRHTVAASQYAQEVQAHAALAMPQYSRMGPVPPYSQHLQASPLSTGAAMPHIPAMSMMSLPHPYEGLQKLVKVMQDQRELLQGVTSSPASLLEVQRMWWTLYNQHAAANLEPQHEALNLAESPKPSMKREISPSPSPSSKRRATHSSSPPRSHHHPCAYFSDMHIRSPDNSQPAALKRRHRDSVSPLPPPCTSPHASPSPRHSPRPSNAARASASPRAASPQVTPPQAVAPAAANSTLPTPPLSDPTAQPGHAQVNGSPAVLSGASFRIITRNDSNPADSGLSVSVEVNGVKYKGILYPAENGV